MVLLLVFSSLALILFVCYLLSIRKFNYWKNKNVPHLKPTPLLGNYGDYILLRRFVGEAVQDLCLKFPREPYIGAYFGTEPALIVQDPELIKLVTTKDFYYFSSREIMKHTHREVVGRNLFFTYGDRWRATRQNMTPLFSSAKMKNMFPFIQKCCIMFDQMVENEIKMSNVVDIRDIMARYTTDCVCSCGFGIDTNTMGQEGGGPTNEFRIIGKLIFDNSNMKGFSLVLRQIFPALFYGLGFKVFPDAISDFFHELLTNVFKGRQYKPSGRNDFVDMILNLKKNEYITCDSLTNMKTNEQKQVKLKVDDEFLVAQCVAFFGAGFETSATTSSLTLYELAKNQESQRRAAEEVDEYLRQHDGKIEYDCVTKLPFLEACIDETMRLYPVLSLLTREVVEDYTMPDGLKLEKGLRIHLPVYHMHHDPEHFPEPEQFRPERFSSENKHNIKPYTYMPFGEGPRICIGMRFAKMQMIPGLMMLLQKYRLEVAEGTPQKLSLDSRAIVTQCKDDLKLRLVKREK